MAIDISVCVTAARPQNWQRVWNSFDNPRVPFEAVFVGPRHPIHAMPSNFRFIQSLATPCQCFEMAWRAAEGTYILHIADDFEFITPQPLDHLVDTFLAENNSRAMISPSYSFNGQRLSPAINILNVEDSTSAILPTGMLLKKQALEDIGGVNQRFRAVYWDADIALRLCALGGKVVVDPNVWVNEGDGGNHLLRANPQDRALLDSLWSPR